MDILTKELRRWRNSLRLRVEEPSIHITVFPDNTFAVAAECGSTALNVELVGPELYPLLVELRDLIVNGE